MPSRTIVASRGMVGVRRGWLDSPGVGHPLAVGELFKALTHVLRRIGQPTSRVHATRLAKEEGPTTYAAHLPWAAEQVAPRY